MLTALAALMPLAAPVPQQCAIDLPSPPGDVRNLGDEMAAAGDIVVASETFQSDFYVWRRDAQGEYALESIFVFPGTVTFLATDGSSIAAATSAGVGLDVWTYDGSGWLASPPLAPAPGSTELRPPVVVDGDLLLARGQAATICAYRRDPATGIWEFQQEIETPDAPDATFGSEFDYADGLLAVAARSTFPNQGVEIFRQTQTGAFAYESRLPEVVRAERFDVHEDRILVGQETFAQVWRRKANGTWVLEETLNAPAGKRVGAVALASNWAVTGVVSPGLLSTHPSSVYRRRPGSTRWVQRGALAPEGGVDHPDSEYAANLSIVDGLVFGSESGFTDLANVFGNTEGRVAVMDLECVSPPPVVHWVPALLTPPQLPIWPSDYTALDVAAEEAIATGPPMGLRNAEVLLDADYEIVFTGLPCFASYTTSICAFFGYALRDAASGDASNQWPIDPFLGMPQFFDLDPGPNVVASSSPVQLTTDYDVLFSESPSFEISPTGQPLELEFAASPYNCVDTTGSFFQHQPDVIGMSSCAFLELPSSVTDLDLEIQVAAEIAYDLEPLGAGLQFPVCDAAANSTGMPARLVAEGSSSTADDALFLAVSDVPPQTSGYLLIAADPAMPPFAAVGDGQLCLATPMVNLTASPALADAYGQVAARVPVGALPGGFVAAPGQTLFLQFIYRDRNSGPTTNTSNALGVMFQ